MKFLKWVVISHERRALRGFGNAVWNATKVGRNSVAACKISESRHKIVCLVCQANVAPTGQHSQKCHATAMAGIYFCLSARHISVTEHKMGPIIRYPVSVWPKVVAVRSSGPKLIICRRSTPEQLSRQFIRLFVHELRRLLHDYNHDLFIWPRARNCHCNALRLKLLRSVLSISSFSARGMRKLFKNRSRAIAEEDEHHDNEGESHRHDGGRRRSSITEAFVSKTGYAIIRKPHERRMSMPSVSNDERVN